MFLISTINNQQSAIKYLFPTLIQLGPLSISFLGLMTAIGFFMATFLVWQKGREEHFDELLLMDVIILTSLIGLAASRIWFCLENWQQAIPIFDLLGKPGFSWKGALVAGTITFKLWCRKYKWDFYKVSDLAVFGLSIALICAKIGLFISVINFKNFFKTSVFYEILFLILVYRLLHIFDRDYRTYEWYKDKRGETKPGFLFLVFVGLTNLIFWLSDLWSRGFRLKDLYQNGYLFLFLLTAILFYYRTGRGLTIILPSFKKRRRFTLENKIPKARIKTGMEVK